MRGSENRLGFPEFFGLGEPSVCLREESCTPTDNGSESQWTCAGRQCFTHIRAFVAFFEEHRRPHINTKGTVQFLACCGLEGRNLEKVWTLENAFFSLLHILQS